MVIFNKNMLPLHPIELYQTQTLNKKQAQEMYLFLRIQSDTILKELAIYF